LIPHYRTYGVESFYIVRHAESTDDPGFDEIEERARAHGVELFHTHVGPWDDNLHGRLMTAAMDEHPDDWYLPVDLDEFHVYDRPLADLVELCERNEYTHVCGCFVDRLGPDGTLPDLTESPLWEQFPLGGAVTSRMLKAPPIKLCLIRGRTGTGGGHHGIPGTTGVPQDTAYVQIHHFKWTGSLVQRMRRRAKRYESGAWHLVYPSVLTEARRVLDHLDRNGGRVNTKNPQLYLHQCGSRYEECGRWGDIANDARRWEWILQGG